MFCDKCSGRQASLPPSFGLGNTPQVDRQNRAPPRLHQSSHPATLLSPRPALLPEAGLSALLPEAGPSTDAASARARAR